MLVEALEIEDVKRFVPRRHGDARGYFAETFRADIFAEHCGEHTFVQDNESRSARVGTLRGLHFQIPPHAQGKLVRCTAGALHDVAVDLREGSPTFGRWVGATLSAQNGHQLWVPPGFAHGFCSLEPDTVIAYKVTDYYSPECDRGLSFDDPDLAVDWPRLADRETLSAKDRTQPRLAALGCCFAYEEA